LAAYRQLGSDWNMSRALQGMAQAQSRLGEHRAAMALLEEGWHMLLPALPYERVPGAKFRQHWGLSQLDDWAQMHAQVLARWGQATEDPLVMAEALANYEAFFDVNDSMRCYYQSADSRQELIRYYLPVYEEAIDLAWTLGQRTGEARYAERALGLAERIKARNLADQLRDQQVLSFAGVPDSVYQQEQQLRQRMVALDEAMSVADSSEQTALRLQRHQVASRYQQLRERLAADYPRYFSLRYLPDSSTPTEWLASLAPDEVAYDYFWGDSLLFVFRLWEGEVRMWRHLMGDGDSLITDLNDWLQYLRVPPQEGDDWAQPYRQGQRLGADLLPALPTEASKLRIVPHGPLAYLPFETLLLSDSKPPEGRWAKWPYVLRDHAVSYGYRLSLGMAQSSVAFDASQSYLGLAPVFGADEQATDRGQLGALTHNRAEVTQAAALWQGQALLGAEAYEGQLTQGFPPLKVLHLATHAQVDDADPMQSRLYLAKDPREGADGVLHAYEIYGLRLPAALTVLSACETGRGTWARGEGVMSLARAFRYAGSEQLVYGLWQVDDQAATALTGQLFAGLKAGDRPSAALRSAKLAWLQQASVRQSHPFFWASLVLNGQDQPLPTQPTWPWWTWGGLAILLLPLGWWGWRRLVHDAG
jgi:CHAT domain-containing protein